VAAHPTRRVVLAAAAALPLAAVAGCDGVDVLAAPPHPAPDVGQLRSAIAAEQLMIARYTAVLGGAAPDTVTAALRPLLAEHQAHLAQLRSRLIVPAGSPTPPGHSGAARVTVPSDPGAAAAFLRDAEQAASAALLGRLLHAPASLAQLFASISASEATHVPVLDAVAAR
jgi:hypothetical protein